MWEKLPDATVQILASSSEEPVGSGFHLRSQYLVVTNAHVVIPFINRGDTLLARTESGERQELSLINHSSTDEYDFAVLEVDSKWSDERMALKPSTQRPNRGADVLFSGHPLGYSDLLVQRGVVSGPAEDGFSIDAAVNSGNSGGPVVHRDTGDVLGIITVKGGVPPEEMESIYEAWSKVYFEAKRDNIRIQVGGYDQMEMNKLIAKTFDALSGFITEYTSTGIGKAVSIEYADSAVVSHKAVLTG